MDDQTQWKRAVVACNFCRQRQVSISRMNSSRTTRLTWRLQQETLRRRKAAMYDMSWKKNTLHLSRDTYQVFSSPDSGCVMAALTSLLQER